MVSVQGSVNSTASIAPHDEPECVAALRSLRRQAARHHVTLAADNITLLQLEQLGALRLWDSHIILHPQEAERAPAAAPCNRSPLPASQHAGRQYAVNTHAHTSK